MVSGFLASCSEEVSTEGVTPSTRLFKVLNDTVYIDAKAADGSDGEVAKTFTVTADCDWNLQTNAWSGLHADPDHGVGTGTVTITTPANENPSERKGTLTITTSIGIKKTLTLIQRSGSVVLEVVDELRFGKDGGSTEVAINCNTSWTLTGGTDWCRSDIKEGMAGTTTVTITADATNEKDTRTATFSVTPTGSTSSKKISVTQSPKEIILAVSPESMAFDANTSLQKEITITCNDEWDATVSHDWVKIDGTKISASGTGNATLNVSCESNTDGKERSGTITVTCSGITKKTTITQYSDNVTFNINPNPLPEFSAEGGSQTVTVTSNTSWKVSGGSDWCRLNVTSDGIEGDMQRGNGTVELIVDPNPSTDERATHIVFEPKDRPSVTITVTQVGNDILLYVSPQEMEFEGDGSEEEHVEILCNTNWVATRTYNWLNISSTLSGNGNGTLTISCKPNTTGAARRDTITVRAGDKSATVAVLQKTTDKPVVYNLAVSDTLDYKATLEATYSSTLPVTECGFVYAIDRTPTLENADGKKVCIPTSGQTGTMSCTLTELKLHTRYHVRAYATNASGTAYSDEKEFTANGPRPGQDDNGFPTLNNH